MKPLLLALSSATLVPLAHAQIVDASHAVDATSSIFDDTAIAIGAPVENRHPGHPALLDGGSSVELGETAVSNSAIGALQVQLDQKQAVLQGTAQASLTVDGQIGASLETYTEAQIVLELDAPRRLRIGGELLRHEEVLGTTSPVHALLSRVDVLLIGEDGSFQLWEAPVPSLAASGPEPVPLAIDLVLQPGRHDLIVRASINGAVGLAQFVEPSSALASYDLEIELVDARSVPGPLGFGGSGEVPTPVGDGLVEASGTVVVVGLLESFAADAPPFLGHDGGLVELVERAALPPVIRPFGPASVELERFRRYLMLIDVDGSPLRILTLAQDLLG